MSLFYNLGSIKMETNIEMDTIDVPGATRTPRQSFASIYDTSSEHCTLREGIINNQLGSVLDFISKSKSSQDLQQIIEENEGENMLLFASRHGRIEIVKNMLAHPNLAQLSKKTNKDRKTPLIVASEMGHEEIAKLLISHYIEIKEETMIDFRDHVSCVSFSLADYKQLFFSKRVDFQL